MYSCTPNYFRVHFSLVRLAVVSTTFRRVPNAVNTSNTFLDVLSSVDSVHHNVVAHSSTLISSKCRLMPRSALSGTFAVALYSRT